MNVLRNISFLQLPLSLHLFIQFHCLKLEQTLSIEKYIDQKLLKSGVCVKLNSNLTADMKQKVYSTALIKLLDIIKKVDAQIFE